jgi:tetratricopeptide (TPR) repeat protein
VVADFDPRQLDALEDALEDLEIDGDLAGLELAPELLERLAEYQQVLALTRDAFPLDDPPEGLLDGVLAEAREVARNAPVITPVARGGWRRAWDRWRGSVVPFAALASAAALVLWIARPGDPHELAVVDSPKSEAKEDAPSEPAMPERDSAEAAGSAAKSEVPQLEPSEVAEIEPPSEPSPTPEQPKPTKRKSTASGSGAAAPPTPAVAPDPVTPLSKDDAWSDLERADAARRKGDCDRARTIYEKVIAASSQANATAQAKAGIGLCFEQDGKASKASEFFDQARASNPGIDAWIRSQRDDQPLPGEKKKTKANDAFEPLDSL